MPKKTKPKHLAAGNSCVLSLTETDAGLQWLNSLTEDQFRDKILEHLFRNMQKVGVLNWYQNIHGRNDKGVDYLLVFNSELGGQRIIGIQAKSQRVTRTGASNTYSSLEVKRECEAAMKHEFDVQKCKSRLDNIELWCSSHITEDAEKEFNAAGDSIKVQVKTAAQIFSQIEKHCSDLIKKIPNCALSNFVRDKSNPQPKKLKLLGCEIHPKKHFLEPIFSKNALGSVSSIQTRNKIIQKKVATTPLTEIIFSGHHSLIVAPELSGKTYLLEHIQCLVAEAQSIPILVNKSSFVDEKPKSIYNFIAKHLGFCSPHDVEQLVKNNRVFILVDDCDSLSEEVCTFLFSQNANQIKVLATGRKNMSSTLLQEVFYMTGVNLGCITKFLRGLDVGLAENKTFIDRAHSFIGRTLATSGLPSTPFTISMMLGECQNSSQKFSTPTMGRLIERFVEMQLGGHSDMSNRVDFETKREFLTKLGGRKNSEFDYISFKREVVKFIESRSHPHSLDDFLSDLKNSGVFTFNDNIVYWSHPVLKQYYWVKNLVSKGNIKPILRKLQKNQQLTLAALTGSQMQDGVSAINELVKGLDKIRMPAPAAVLDIIQEGGLMNLFKNDEDEDKWLNTLEIEGNIISPLKNKHPIASLADSNFIVEETASEKAAEEAPANNADYRLDEKTREELKAKLEPLITQMADSKLHMAFNLAALLVNARNTKTASKQECVKHILNATQFLGRWFQVLIESFYEKKSKTKFDMAAARIFTQMLLTDRMIGDPFLVSIFKKMLPHAKTDEEKIMLLDLLLGCGEDDEDLILEKLKSIIRPEFIVAFYLRVTVLYFFRFHRDKDRQFLRKLLKEIRKLSKAVPLMQVAT